MITGASDGIGAAAAEKLVAGGHEVVIVGRSRTKTTAVSNRLKAPFFVTDFSDLAQVRALARDLKAAYPRIDVLANNAGGVFGKRTVTTDGHETTFQVNHLAPFLLTTLLLPTLTASGASVVATSSVAARLYSDINPDDWQSERGYTPNTAYGNAKLANILFTKELQRRYGSQGVNAVSFHPGYVASNFANDTTSWFRIAYRTPLRHLIMTTPQKAAERLTWLAEGTAGSTWQQGGYYDGKKVGTTHTRAADDDLARRLWDDSARMV
ncbi:SDR family NAD(P)-dependent oxidoreductase [Kineococcus sp. GCM10028916]|uniref:SDR family NAD(P)-dependent oxidoreductase n=1 Tax=Kineococcus sp. GCM10028916 TaxID=3273394 RepID=UPI003637AE46